MCGGAECIMKVVNGLRSQTIHFRDREASARREVVSGREARVSRNDRTGQLLEAEFERLMMRVPGQGTVAAMKRIDPGKIDC